jgi:hypothetical protein
MHASTHFGSSQCLHLIGYAFPVVIAVFDFPFLGLISGASVGLVNPVLIEIRESAFLVSAVIRSPLFEGECSRAHAISQDLHPMHLSSFTIIFFFKQRYLLLRAESAFLSQEFWQG